WWRTSAAIANSTRPTSRRCASCSRRSMMGANELLRSLLEATAFTSLAILLVLALRRPLRAGFGSRVAYAAWALVPVSLIAVLLPAAPVSVALPALAPVAFTYVPQAADGVAHAASVGANGVLAALWVLGTVAAISLLVHRQRRFRRGLGQLRRRADGLQADASAGLPAAMGWLRPAIVLPADFDSRYDAGQRALMLAHERMHISRGDLHANAFAAALGCLFWFNPLLHFAMRSFRHDQELACDACVVAAAPTLRRAYGEALLQAQFAAQGMPLGCHFGFGHPLKERITMLKESLPSPARRIAGSALVASMVFGVAFAAWATQPQQAETKPDLDWYARKVSTPAPAYPEAARAQRISGMVVLLIDIAADGSVAKAEIDRGEPAGVFDDAALAAVANWKFQPAMKDGKAVPSRVRVPIEFAMKPKVEDGAAPVKTRPEDPDPALYNWTRLDLA